MIAKVISEFQASEEMVATKKSICDEGFEVGVRAFYVHYGDRAP